MLNAVRQRWFPVFLFALVALPGRAANPAPPADGKASGQVSLVDVLALSEEFILTWTPELKRLNKSLMNLRVPDPLSVGLFDDKVKVWELAGAEGHLDKELHGAASTVRHWDIAAEPKTISSAELSLWDPIVKAFDYVEFDKFYFIRGDFTTVGLDEWAGDVGFEATGRLKDGSWRVAKSRVQTVWKKRPAPPVAGAKPTWVMTQWKPTFFKTYDAPHKLFEDVLERVIPDVKTRTRLRKSKHDEIILKAVTDKNFKLPKYFNNFAFDRHPGLAVVDIDRDGWDDLYLMDQWVPNVLLRNNHDGTFTDVAPQLGLDIDSHCSSAIFADFDNDGDTDAFIGGTLRRSLYFENDKGKFVDRTDSRVGVALPYFVSSLTSADINNDGLLDIYFATYGGDQIERELIELQKEYGGEWATKGKTLLAEFLPSTQATELFQRAVREHRMVLNKVGPPNMLLVNRGGWFSLSPASKQVAVWKNTYQATFGDYDGDGKVDLYCANDFSLGNLFRNKGDGNFEDVTEKTGTADIGFGMGAAWGDYDNDGKMDLYKSNMFSKAGQRVTGKLGNMLDPRFAKMAAGNTLFRNQGSDFKRVSGMEPPAMLVELGGWSWGGQFFDADNDGYLDIFVASGYYSAPEDIALTVDL